MLKQDLLVKNQAILRNKEREFKQKREIKLPQGPGSISVGTIYDCNRNHFERLLKAYWDKLYVGWNPFKSEGLGCWEIWQRPLKKTPVLQYHDEITGDKIYTLEYRSSDYEHWVADLPHLSYAFIEKLKKMDSWENKNQVSDHDYEHAKYQDKLEAQENENIRNVVKDNKKHFRDLLDYVQSGYDPVQFFYRK